MIKLFKLYFIIILSISIYANDLTKHIEVLGNPYKEYYKTNEGIYSRNIWDMQLFNGKIYLGGGNSSNKGPSSNSGRTPIIVLNTKSNTFKEEYKVAEEQINIYKTYNDTLYIPGHDATQKWDFGNIYIKTKQKKWKKLRTIPNALHLYDLVVLNDILYVSIGFYGYSGIGKSVDNGKSWKIKKYGKGRIYSIVSLDDKIVIDRDIVYNNLKAIRIKKVDNSIFYISATKHNDHQSIPISLYKANLKNNKIVSQKLNIPNDFLPRDIIVREGNIYLLTSKIKDNKSIIKVLKYLKNDYTKFSKVLEFRSSTFARSFEELNGTFYFGLGCEIESYKNWKQSELKKDTGTILKIDAKYIREGK